MTEKMLWNVDKTASVKASKIRHFSITKSLHRMPDLDMCVVNGWYNPNEGFYFGEFKGLEAAQEYLQGIHDYIES